MYNFRLSDQKLGNLFSGGSVVELEVKIHKAEDGGYWAEVPSIPGCMTQGDSIEELFENIRDAIEGCLSVREEMLFEKLFSTVNDFQFDIDKYRKYFGSLEKFFADIDMIRNIDIVLPLPSTEQRALNL